MFTLFTQPGCAPCKSLAARLRAKKLAHTILDIREDAAAMQRMKALGGMGTPFVVNESTGEVWKLGDDIRFFECQAEWEHPRAGQQGAA